MKAKVYVTLKNGVLDPQGTAIAKSLKNIGVDGIKAVRQGKFFELELDSKQDADAQIKKACESILANTVIENFRYELVA
jgi:phosphoribosylformylglycinamidine synthase PurS subunit